MPLNPDGSLGGEHHWYTPIDNAGFGTSSLADRGSGNKPLTLNSTVQSVRDAVWKPSYFDFDGHNHLFETATWNWDHSGPVTLSYWRWHETSQIEPAAEFGVTVDSTAYRLGGHHPYFKFGPTIYWDYGDHPGTAERQSYALPGNIHGRWYHVVCTSTGAGGAQQRIWVDGVQVATKNTSTGPSQPINHFGLGGNAEGTSTGVKSTIGRFTDVRLFRSVLTASQIADLFAFKAYEPPPLVLSVSASPNPAAPNQNVSVTVGRTGGGITDGQTIYQDDFASTTIGQPPADNRWQTPKPTVGTRQGRKAISMPSTFVVGNANPATLNYDVIAEYYDEYVRVYVNNVLERTHNYTSDWVSATPLNLPPNATIRFEFDRYEDDAAVNDIRIVEPSNTATDALPVDLTSSQPSVLTLPASVTIPAGQPSVTLPPIAVGSDGTTTLTGSYDGVQAPSYNFTATTPKVVIDIPGRDRMEAGVDYPYTVTRQGLPTTDPLSVTVTSSNVLITHGGDPFVIPAGQSTVTRLLRPVTPGTTTMTATAAGVQSSSQTITVIQPLARVQSVSISPTSPVQGEMVTVTLTRGPGRIDDGVSHVIVQSAVERLTFPAPESVNIPAGQTTASFVAQALAAGNAAIEVYITGSPSEGGATLQYGFAIREAGDRQTTYTNRGLILRETGELSTKTLKVMPITGGDNPSLTTTIAELAQYVSGDLTIEPNNLLPVSEPPTIEPVTRYGRRTIRVAGANPVNIIGYYVYADGETQPYWVTLLDQVFEVSASRSLGVDVRTSTSNKR